MSVPSHSKVNNTAGVAAAVSEEAKDKQYLHIVNESGGDFVPLICVWNALSTLFSIADRCTIKNGKTARRQLLSVTLWRHNS